MAKASQKRRDTVKQWKDRISLAIKQKREWRERFRPDELYRWYEGYQGQGSYGTGDFRTDPYIINLIAPSIEVKIPNLYFYNPTAKVTPKPTRDDDQGTTIDFRATLRGDMLNTYVLDPRNRFKDHTTMAVFESFFSYGVVEIGHTIDWTQNPNANKPMTYDDTAGDDLKGKPIVDPDSKKGEYLMEPAEVASSEEFFIRRIEASDFYVCANPDTYTEHCDWIGYTRWHYLSDLRGNPRYNQRELKPEGKLSQAAGGKPGEASSDELAEVPLESRDMMILVWYLYDQRAKQYLALSMAGDDFLIEPESYSGRRIFDFRQKLPLSGWYPIPPCFNWMSPQAEYNDSRQQQKVHRNRVTRRYQIVQGLIEKEEIEKFETGGDGTMVFVKQPNAISAITDAPLDRATFMNIVVTKEDFQNISGVGGEQRAQAESETATQANIIDKNLEIRDNYSQEKVANFLGEILYGMQRIIDAEVELPQWVKRLVDPLGPEADMQMLEVVQGWYEITSDMLGDLTYDVSVDPESLKPKNSSQESQLWFTALGLFKDPQMLMTFVASPEILRRTLEEMGITSSKDVALIEQGVQLTLLMLLGQQPAPPGTAVKDAGSGKAGGSGRSLEAGGETTPSNAETQGQLAAQGF
jgi:hypothetical protein